MCMAQGRGAWKNYFFVECAVSETMVEAVFVV